MLKGLPASGKTTYAKELVAQGWKRVNKDDLRAMIDCSKWSKQNEKDIIEARDLLIIHYLDNGFNVVVDDTNFHPAHQESLIEIADNCDADFEEKFFDTPIDECIARDAKRGDKSVGGDVIFRMYYKYLRKPSMTKESIDFQLPFAYIFDLDGTLALMTDRSPFDWAKVGEDELNISVGATMKALKAAGFEIIILSGRDEECREETQKWLNKYELYHDMLLMRGNKDNRKDNIIKQELYEANVKGKYNVVGVFDDRDQVVSLWRSLGLTCFQCDYGNF